MLWTNGEAAKKQQHNHAADHFGQIALDPTLPEV